MEIIIQGSAKEIAGLVIALQDQPKKKELVKDKIYATLDGTVLYQAVRKANDDKV